MKLLHEASSADPLVCVRSDFWNFNSVGLVHPEGSLVIDPGIRPEEIEALRQATGPVQHVVLTHSHHDHIRGWQGFPGARVVMPSVAAHKPEESQERILASKRWLDERLSVEDPGFAYPIADATFDQHLALACGSLDVELHFLPGHSNCTSVVWVPAIRTLLTADYLVEPGLPYCRWQALEFEQAMAWMAEFCASHDVQRIVPSHNDWIEGPDAIEAAIVCERRYFELMRESIEQAAGEGLERSIAEERGVRAVRAWRTQDVGRRERQDVDNARRVADEAYAAFSSM